MAPARRFMLAMVIVTFLIFAAWTACGVFSLGAEPNARKFVEMLLVLPTAIFTTICAIGWLILVGGSLWNLWH